MNDDRLHVVQPTNPNGLVVVNDLGVRVAKFEPGCKQLAAQAVHSYNMLPRLLRAHAAQEKAIADHNAACAADDEPAIQRTHDVMELAFDEFDAAIAAAKEMPDA
jgi:hypothetical protein